MAGAGAGATIEAGAGGAVNCSGVRPRGVVGVFSESCTELALGWGVVGGTRLKAAGVVCGKAAGMGGEGVAVLGPGPVAVTVTEAGAVAVTVVECCWLLGITSFCRLIVSNIFEILR